MRKRLTALMMTAALACGSLIACGSESTTAYASETIYGEVTAVSDTGFTITVGTYENNELTLGEETADITVSDSTTYSMAMAGGGEAPSGDGEAPTKPDDVVTEESTDETTEETTEETTDEETTEDTEDSSDDTAMTEATVEAGAEAPADGEAPSGDKPDGEAPSGDKPEGEAPSGDGEAPADMGNAQAQISFSDIEVGTQVAVTFDADGNVESVEILGGTQSAMGQPGGNMTSAADITYSALYEYNADETVEGESIASTGTDENAILVTDGEVTVKDSTITRTSDDSTGGDNSSFYGVGATLLTTGGTLTVDNVTIDSDAAGGAGVFAYGDGVAYVSNSTITTQQNTSGGIHVAGGGTLYANDNTVETNGESSAAIRSDRGGGTMVVDGGTYTSNGTGSPAVYCTADITISNATLTATGAEAVCIEGLNSLTLTDCDLTGNIPTSEQNDCDWNIILYQSMSGDSEVGNSTFSMTGGSITAKNGGMFYTTNTESTFVLENVDITYADENDFFLKVTGNANQRGWGTSGENGAQCSFTAINQEMEGDIIWDTISTLDMEMTDGSVLTGAFIDDESAAGNGGDGYANLTIDSSSKWIVTGDSVLTSLTNNGTIVDEDGNTVSIVGTDGTVYVEGTSSYTITVSEYAD
ncbi:hypothetical protein SAMN02910377_00843 [Pseudobutyrivibrio ruminis]|uniref:Right handed beta helix domain-containing protein n=1 Tax=Pseudobutyrivibrio ruminis TaxID=46206 RepID=A0A1H7GXP7_9FIRM|nr:right-handed parallel beta-helix repeat-containing protein [Pseudobutyrivibrio ruminis]SEK42923.1 hypothetical protein SAMN02910377_00843 [Pseudobutyrivibrio ruminis]